jgi:hypothetical protein
LISGSFEPGQAEKGEFIGIALARVAEIRALGVEIRTNAAVTKVRALCVLDLVEKGDIDAHATAGYCEATEPSGIGQAYLGKVRMTIRMDLANVFSDVSPADKHHWPPG